MEEYFLMFYFEWGSEIPMYVLHYEKYILTLRQRCGIILSQKKIDGNFFSLPFDRVGSTYNIEIANFRRLLLKNLIRNSAYDIRISPPDKTL